VRTHPYASLCFHPQPTFRVHSHHQLSLSRLFVVRRWGRNNAGQLGLPRSKAPQVTPTLVMRAARKFRVSQVAAGGYAYQYEGHSVLLTEKNEV
jgi:hypothetical protein